MPVHIMLMLLEHGHKLHHFVICTEPFLTVNRWTGIVHGTGITCLAHR